MHEQHITKEPDDNFEPGTLAHLVSGNEGRVLDGRRTPGYIESYDEESGMFVWRITAFEDKGKCWEIPAEQIDSYQFRKGSALLSHSECALIQTQCDQFSQRMVISRFEEAWLHTQTELAEAETAAKAWLSEHSRFFSSGKTLELSAQTGDEDLFSDLQTYMKDVGLSPLEERTAQQYLLNPYSGEWIKGMKITMAEMGLIDYSDTIPRTKDIFTGIGDKLLRKRYILARVGFIRAVFSMSGYTEVPLYRGVSSPVDLFETPCTLLSATFSSDTAKAFASVENSADVRSCYYVKFTYPVENLFMTYLETKELNERYQEQEAILFYRKKLAF